MSRNRKINVALIGHQFMGKAHSNAWTQVNRFFRPPMPAFMHTVIGRDAPGLKAFAERFDWASYSTDWKKAIAQEEIDLVDVTAANDRHRDMSIAALEAGKHVTCEKPLAGNLDEAREMVAAARKHKKQRTFVWYNYRRCPAVAMAYRLVKAGRIGQVRHVRGVSLQDWADASIPLIWRFDKKVAGSGSHGDLNAHVIDMCRFVTGEEITEICGAVSETFVKERTLMTGGAGGGIAANVKAGGGKGKVQVDDAVLFLARFAGGGVGSFEATRMATGNQNRTGFEINGTKGAVRFNFERMNELEFYDATEERSTQGWRTIMCTHGGSHPYAEAWWPDAHVLGYEHSFVNQAYDTLLVLAGKRPTVPLPDFEDAYQTQRVLAASLLAAKEHAWVKLSQVK